MSSTMRYLAGILFFSVLLGIPAASSENNCRSYPIDCWGSINGISCGQVGVSEYCGYEQFTACPAKYPACYYTGPDPQCLENCEKDHIPPHIIAIPPALNVTIPNFIHVILTLRDENMRVARGRYMIDGLADTRKGLYFEESTVITIVAPGHHFISVWATDDAGNTQTAVFGPYRINTETDGNSNQNISPQIVECPYSMDAPETIRSGTVLAWLRLCGPSFEKLLEEKEVATGPILLTDSFDRIVSSAKLPSQHSWTPTEPSGNIQTKLREMLQKKVCALADKEFPIDLLLTTYHLEGFPFFIMSDCPMIYKE